MKKILLSLSLLLSFAACFGQNILPRANGSVTVQDENLFAHRSFKVPAFTDTTQANTLYPTLDSCGKIIFTYLGNALWYRQCNPKKWILVGTSVINNSTTSVTILNDSTLIICSGPSNCDTINIGNTINNVSYTYFSNDSTIVFCNASNVCDSVVIPQPITLIGQNGVIIPFPGAFEIGATPFYHATDIYTNGFNFTMNQTQTGSFRIKQNAASNNAILELINPDIAGVELRLLGNGKIRSSNTNISLMGYNDTVNLISQFYGGLTFPPYPNTRNDGPISKALSTDASGNLILGTLNTAPQGCGLQSGGLITWDSLLVFDVAPADYCINDVSYSAPFTVVTLAPGDASFARYDAVIADTNGVISVLQGTPSADPLFPQADPESQLVLSYILVNANETVFSGILQTVIYDEGVEWDTLANGLTTNFLNTANPLHLTHAADVGAITNGDYDQFTYNSTVDLNNYSVLKLYVRLKSTFANNARITFLWMNGNVIINTNTVSIGGNNSLYNFVRTTVGAYQVITIPINAWVLNSTTANRLRIRYTGANAQGVYLDWIQLQGGIQQGQGGPTGIQSLSVTGNPIISAAVTNPTGPNTVVALNLSNACAGCFLANQTVSSAPPTYAPINLSNNGSFTGLLNPAFIDTAPVNGSFLQSLSGVTQWVSLPSGYDTTFVVNGLTVIPGVNNDTLSWGGTLRQNTTIDSRNGDYQVQFLGDAGNTQPLVYATGGAQGLAGTGTSVGVTGTSPLVPLWGINTATNTATVGPALVLNRLPSGSGAAGLGASIQVNLPDASGSTEQAGLTQIKWTTATNLTETSAFEILLRNAGASAAVKASLSGPGKWTWSGYGVGAFTGTTAFGLGVDASGNVIEIGGSSFPTMQQVFNTEVGGSVLTKVDTISAGANYLYITGSKTGSTSGVLFVNNTDVNSSNAIYATSSGTNAAVYGNGVTIGVIGAGPIGVQAIGTTNSGIGASATSGAGGTFTSTSGLGISVTINPSSTSSVVEIEQNLRKTSGTAANGIGGKSAYYIETTDGTTRITNEIISKWTDATTATRTSQFDITGVNSAATETYANFQTGGIVRVNNLADTLSTKAYARSLSSSGGWGTTGTIATLTGASVVDLDGNTLEFSDAGTKLGINPDPTDAVVELGASNSTGGGNIAGFNSETMPTQSNAQIYALFNAAAKDANITAVADATTSTISYTADTHTFNGEFSELLPSGGIFRVLDFNSSNLIFLKSSTFNSYFAARDNTTGEVSLDMTADVVGNDITFNLLATDATNSVNIGGDAVAQTILLTAANGTTISSLAGTGTRTVLASSAGLLSAPISDFTTKQNIQPLDYGIETLMKLNPVSFEYRKEYKNMYGQGTQIGFIAQDIQYILPNSVYRNLGGIGKGKLGYNETDIIPVLVKAVQEQQSQIEKLKRQINHK